MISEPLSTSSPASAQVVEVRFSSVQDVRAAIFSILDEFPARQRSKLASKLAALLRDGRWLADPVESYYNATSTAAKLGRSPEFIVKECKSGRFGRVFRDDGGWLIPASGIESWLARRVYGEVVALEK